MSRAWSSPRLIAALGLAQIVSWGALYYGFSLFVTPMREDLGWSLTTLNGALTAGLLVAGLCAYPIGGFIDRHGGRAVMTLGSLCAALLLAAWSTVDSVTGFYAVWLGLGVCMAAVLYEPVFVVLTHHFGDRARQAITHLTLIAGFASTVFMPLIEVLLASLPWRSVLLVMAALVAILTVPVHALLVPRHGPAADAPHHAPAMAETRGVLRRRLRQPAFWGLALWFTAWGGTASGLMFQLVPWLKSVAVPQATILLTVALVGPMQVAGRVLLMLAGERAGIAVAGAFTTTAMPLAVLILILAPPDAAWLVLFAALFGSANGVTTILRGAAPAEWLGREAYGRTMGVLGAPMMFAAALAPLATATLWSHGADPAAMHWAVFVLAVGGALGFWLALLTRDDPHCRPRQRAAGTPPI